MIIFLFCGLWHGANLTFVIWGGLHGLFLSIGYLFRSYSSDMFKIISISDRGSKIIKILITFHLVTFSWIFFRANTIADAWCYVSGLFSKWPKIFIDANTMSYGMVGILIVIIVDTLKFNGALSLERFSKYPAAIRWGCYYALLMAIVLAGVENENAFIYYQF